MTETARVQRMLTVDDMAERFRTTRGAIHHLRHNGRLPKAYKVGRNLLWDSAEVDAWLHEQHDDRRDGSKASA